MRKRAEATAPEKPTATLDKAYEYDGKKYGPGKTEFDSPTAFDAVTRVMAAQQREEKTLKELGDEAAPGFVEPKEGDAE